VQSVQAVFWSDECGDEEDLGDCVGGVDDLDDDVAGDEIIAVVSTAKQAACLGDEMSYARHAARAQVSLCDQVAVHVIDDVANSFLAHLLIT